MASRYVMLTPCKRGNFGGSSALTANVSYSGPQQASSSVLLSEQVIVIKSCHHERMLDFSGPDEFRNFPPWHQSCNEVFAVVEFAFVFQHAVLYENEMGAVV